MGTVIAKSRFRDALCASFNGTDEYCYVNNPSFKSDTQGAFAFWYRPTTVLSAAGFRGVIGYGVLSGSNNSQLSLLQRYNGGASINATYRNKPIPDILCVPTNAGTAARAYGNHIFVSGDWVHWVFQSNGSSWTHYINGVSVGGTAWSGASNTGDWLGDISGSDHRLSFGSQFVSNAPSGYSDQRQNEAIYVNRPLTGAEVTWLYNGGVPRNPLRGGFGADLKSWWRFGDSRDDATTIYDEVGSNNLTLVNMDASNYVAP